MVVRAGQSCIGKKSSTDKLARLRGSAWGGVDAENDKNTENLDKIGKNY
jgi:hypothetical protein